MSRHVEQMQDRVDEIRAQWAKELPDLRTDGVAIIGRARRITLSLRPRIEKIFKAHGLDAGEFDVLASLRRSGTPYRLRPTELYESLMISSGGLTDRLARLEKRGLVRRIPSPDDRRSLLVQLTPKGVAAVEAALREDMALENDVVSVLTKAEQQQLAQLLRKLAHGIDRNQRAEQEAGGVGVEARMQMGIEAAPGSLRRAVPVLCVSDIQQMTTYFEKRLGFAVHGTAGEPPSWASLKRDAVEIMLVCGNYPEPAADWAAFVYVGDVDALHADMKKRGAEFASDPQNKPHGCREFEVRLPDGRLIAFGAESSTPVAT